MTPQDIAAEIDRVLAKKERDDLEQLGLAHTELQASDRAVKAPDPSSLPAGVEVPRDESLANSSTTPTESAQSPGFAAGGLGRTKADNLKDARTLELVACGLNMPITATTLFRVAAMLRAAEGLIASPASQTKEKCKYCNGSGCRRCDGYGNVSLRAEVSSPARPQLEQLLKAALEITELVTYEIFHEQLKNPSDYERAQYGVKQSRRRAIEKQLRTALAEGAVSAAPPAKDKNGL